MSAFADYEYYKACGGQLSEAEYDASVNEAYREILNRTHGGAENAPSSMQEAVKRCECALVDVIADYRQTDSVLPRGVASVSNDGYSVSASAVGTSKQKAKECHEVCRKYLMYPDNLMYRGI